jgi:hypothetical protein
MSLGPADTVRAVVKLITEQTDDKTMCATIIATVAACFVNAADLSIDNYCDRLKEEYYRMAPERKPN